MKKIAIIHLAISVVSCAAILASIALPHNIIQLHEDVAGKPMVVGSMLRLTPAGAVMIMLGAIGLCIVSLSILVAEARTPLLSTKTLCLATSLIVACTAYIISSAGLIVIFSGQVSIELFFLLVSAMLSLTMTTLHLTKGSITLRKNPTLEDLTSYLLTRRIKKFKPYFIFGLSLLDLVAIVLFQISGFLNIRLPNGYVTYLLFFLLPPLLLTAFYFGINEMEYTSLRNFFTYKLWRPLTVVGIVLCLASIPDEIFLLGTTHYLVFCSSLALYLVVFLYSFNVFKEVLHGVKAWFASFNVFFFTAHGYETIWNLIARSMALRYPLFIAGSSYWTTDYCIFSPITMGCIACAITASALLTVLLKKHSLEWKRHKLFVPFVIGFVAAETIHGLMGYPVAPEIHLKQLNMPYRGWSWTEFLLFYELSGKIRKILFCLAVITWVSGFKLDANRKKPI